MKTVWGPDFSEVIEIAGVHAEDRTKTFSMVVRPNERNLPLQSNIVALTGITTDDVRSAKSFDEVWDEFKQWVNSFGPNPILVAHNGRTFDVPVLCNELRRVHYNKHRKSRTGTSSTTMSYAEFNPFAEEVPSWMFADSLALARATAKYGERSRLKDVCDRYGVEGPSTAHRAMPDAEALARLVGPLAGEHRGGDIVDRDRVLQFWTSHTLPAIDGAGNGGKDMLRRTAVEKSVSRPLPPPPPPPPPSSESDFLLKPLHNNQNITEDRIESLRAMPRQVILSVIDTGFRADGSIGSDDTTSWLTPAVAGKLDEIAEAPPSQSTNPRSIWTVDLGIASLSERLLHNFKKKGYDHVSDVVERWPRRHDVYRPWVSGDVRELQADDCIIFRAYGSDSQIIKVNKRSGVEMIQFTLTVLPLEQRNAEVTVRAKTAHFFYRSHKGRYAATSFKRTYLDPIVKAGVDETCLWRARVKRIPRASKERADQDVELENVERLTNDSITMKIMDGIWADVAKSTLPLGERLPAYCRPFYGDDAPLKDKDFYGHPLMKKVPTGMSVPYHLLKFFEISGGSGVTRDYLSEQDRERIALELADSHKALHGAPLPSWREAAMDMHEPRSLLHLHRAKMRIAFDEMTLLQIYALETGRKDREASIKQGEERFVLDDDTSLVAGIVRSLPYNVTTGAGSQLHALKRCLMTMGCESAVNLDMDLGLTDNVESPDVNDDDPNINDDAASLPMRRLLHGDVGCGKTLVEQLCLLHAAQSGVQGALLCATEALAQQHYETFLELLNGVKNAERIPKVELMTGSMTAKKREELNSRLLNHEVDILVGTTAMVPSDENKQVFSKLGMVVFDECQKYGVRQMSRLADAGHASHPKPHQLHVSATPIPRTMAMATRVIFPEEGVRDTVSIRKYPPNRVPVESRVLSMSEVNEAYREVRNAIERGRVALVVCPRIEAQDRKKKGAKDEGFIPLMMEEEEEEGDDKLDYPSAEDVHAYLSGPESPLGDGVNVGIVTGQASTKKALKERTETLESFRNGEIPVVVCTTVLEVGIDVPDADVVVVLGADCFGLATLHQLRGRIGRRYHVDNKGDAAPTCFFVRRESSSDNARSRLDNLAEVLDGFQVAEMDLSLRGPGSFVSLSQNGPMKLLDVASWSDEPLVLAAAREARRLHKDVISVAGGESEVLKHRLDAFERKVMNLSK